MDAHTVKELLPVITAFANRQPIQFRERAKDGLAKPGEWIDVNPDTNQFRLTEYDLSIRDWRVKP